MKKFFKGKWIRQYGKSLQFRIFVIFMLVGIIPIMLIKQGILRSFEEQSIIQRGSLVQNQCISLAEELVRSGFREIHRRWRRWSSRSWRGFITAASSL